MPLSLPFIWTGSETGEPHADYQKPDRFFERTFLTRNLRDLATEVVRRLSGEKTETSAVFNMATQFDGGKTHALTLLYHLAVNGSKARNYRFLRGLFKRRNLRSKG